MPWKIEDVDKHQSGLGDEQKKKWVTIANSALISCMKDGKDEEKCAGYAIRVANAQFETKNATEYFLALSDPGTGLVEVKLLYPPMEKDIFKHSAYGAFPVTEEQIDEAVKNFSLGIGALKDETGQWVIPGSYEHPPAGESDPEKVKASGRIEKLFKRDNALWASINFTDKAREYINKKEINWLSPVFKENWADENGINHGFTIRGFGLTNVPFLKKGVVAISLTDGEVLLAEWDTAYINNLPDSSFAVIESGGTKDDTGKTMPRSLRHLPYKDKDGKVDLPHLRNALARLSQTKLSPELKKKAENILTKAAQNAGVGEQQQGGTNMKEIRELLKLKEDDDLLGAVKTLTETAGKIGDIEKQLKDIETENKSLKDQKEIVEKENKELKEKSVKDTEIKLTRKDYDTLIEGSKIALDLRKKIELKEITDLVDGALKEGKMVPAQKDATIKLALVDREAVEKMLKDAKTVIEFKEKGSGGDGMNDPKIILYERIKKMAKDEKILFTEAKRELKLKEPAMFEEAGY